MTIKDWNALPQVRKNAVARAICKLDGLEDYMLAKLACNYISVKSKLTIYQKLLLDSTKILANGDIEISIKMTV